jgi:hypothetical protein
MLWVAPPEPTDIIERLFGIITKLRWGLGERGVKERLLSQLMLLTSARLGRLYARVARLATAAREGRFPVARPPRKRTRPERPKPPPEQRLPRRFGWLIQMVPETRQMAPLFQHWLEDPEVRALVEKVPLLGRYLRPLGHMLQLELPAALRLPKRKKPQLGEAQEGAGTHDRNAASSGPRTIQTFSGHAEMACAVAEAGSIVAETACEPRAGTGGRRAADRPGKIRRLRQTLRPRSDGWCMDDLGASPPVTLRFKKA